jgi:CheY-like chemotaxis protein
VTARDRTDAHWDLEIVAEYAALDQLDPWLQQILPDMSSSGRMLIRLALHELCINIIEHAYEGQPGPIWLHARRDNDTLQMTIRDRAAKVFSNRETYRPPSPVLLPERGWGIGIMKSILDHMEYRRLDEGNEWRLTKQIADDDSASVSKPLPIVLVVDDEVITHRLISYTLKPFGIDVVGVDSGDAAFQLLSERSFALVFLDINMPGMDGFTLMNRLRSLPNMADIPLVIITGRDHPGDEARAQRAGASRFLYKPFSTHELRALVHELLKL